ncbi:ribonuclease [Roseomonas sp. BU-1]|uniref:Ribonuclease n=1 Tax=Falsiroseomonas selenitidurans TaxID=2716335 RepID=A0ABX1E2P4_9PROT|nr:ribonuclease [Falsiroseomonas selenitidurans]
MGNAEIRVSVSPGEVRVAGLRDGRLEAVAVERLGRRDGVGDLHRARVAAIAPAMSGAFLTLAGETAAFLPESELPLPRQPIARALQEGQSLAVRLTRAAQGGKGPRASARLSAADSAFAVAQGNGPPLLLRRGPDAAERLAALWPDAELLTDGPSLAARLRPALGDRVKLVLHPAFDEELETAFDALLQQDVVLEGGARLQISVTPALTAFDVDAGAEAGGRDKLAHAQLNRRAALEVARQIRLRNLAGAILVDFAGMTVRMREALLPDLATALLEDPLRPKLLGLTRLGLAEVQRARIHPPLHEVTGLPATPLTRGLAAIRRALREVAVAPYRVWALHAAPETIRALEGAGDALAEYRVAAGRSLVLVPDPARRPGEEEVVEMEE